MTHYIHRFCTAAGRPTLNLCPAVEQALETAPWPGNVRELVNAANYIASLASGPDVQLTDLPGSFLQHARGEPTHWLPIDTQTTPISSIRTDLPYKQAKRVWLDIFEEHYVRGILEEADGNVSAAARRSGMDRRSIQRMLKRQRGDD